jgi:DNA-binding protein HU-alpha
MKKADLVAYIAKHADLSKKAAEAALTATLEAIEKSLKKKDPVQLVGFGTFTVTHRKATTGRNPQTGAQIKIAARNSVRFKAGKKLTEAVN